MTKGINKQSKQKARDYSLQLNIVITKIKLMIDINTVDLNKYKRIIRKLKNDHRRPKKIIKSDIVFIKRKIDIMKDENKGLKTALSVLIKEKETKATKIMELVNELRSNEASSVEIVSDNPDIDKGIKNSAIGIIDSWTGWTTKHYFGDNLIDCLTKALQDKKRKNKPKTLMAKNNVRK